MRKFLTSTLILLIISFNTSCLKKQNLKDDDLGPAIQAQELTKAMVGGFGSLDYKDIKPNEFSSYIENQTVQEVSTSTIEQQDLTIINSVDTPDSLTLDLILTKTKFSAGQNTQSTRKWNEVFSKSDSKSSSVLQNSKLFKDNDPPTYLFIFYQMIALGYCRNEGEQPETCHRLQVTDFKYKVPAAAISQHNCTDPTTCFVNARKIEFDRIELKALDKDGKPKRTHYTFILSKEVPFLSRVLKMCFRGLYEISEANQNILADICYDINNYAFGNQ